MTQMYYRLPDGEPTSNLPALIPHVISPQYLTDAELAEHGVARCTVLYPVVEWWQQRGALQVDAGASPHVVTLGVEPLPLDDVRALAWQRIKEARSVARAQGVEHTFPDGTVGHIQIRDEDVGNLLSIHAAATTAIMQSSIAEIPFTDAENVTRMLAPADALAVAMAAFAHGAAVHVQSQTIRAAIESATDVAGVVAAAAWPGG